MQGLFGKKEQPAQVPDPYGGYGQTGQSPYGYQGEQQPQGAGYGAPAGTAPQGYGGYTPPAGGSAYPPPATNTYDTGGGYGGSTGVGNAGGGGRTHVVAKGDSLYSLSRRYKSSVNGIMQANGLSNPDKIIIGQKLTIP
jgi:nucleoid-associated protein YgaU